MPSSPGSPKRKHKHKHRSRSRSPHERNRHRKKHTYDDSDHDSDREMKKRHKHKHHSRDRFTDSDDDSRPHRHHNRNDRDRKARVKEEPDDRDYQSHGKRDSESRGQRRDRHHNRHIKQESGRVKEEPNSDDDMQSARARNDRRREERRRKHGSRFNTDNDDEPHEFGRPGGTADADADTEENNAPVEKEKPNFELSGKLTEETNTYKGVVIKYSEPAEARKPRKRWRLYPFKDGESLKVLHIHRQSAYLMGRERKIVDIPIDHPSCSKQHSVFQYRLVPYQRANGTTGHAVRPYIIDLGSTNGTYINNNRIEAQRYVQLKEKDVLKFGFSSREYVLIHDKSKTDELEDDDGED